MGTDNPLGPAAVVRGASRGFGVLLVGGLLQPVASEVAALAYVWLLAVALVAFLVAAIAATPSGTPPAAWRQAPIAAVGAYGLVVPLVITGAGELPVVQAVLTTTTAVLIGTATGLLRTRFEVARAAERPV